jgi:hypothetical protein
MQRLMHTFPLKNVTTIGNPFLWDTRCGWLLGYTTMMNGRGFLCSPCCGYMTRAVRKLELVVVCQFSVGHSHGKFVVEELEVGQWWLNVWFADFMCAVVQWYLECDSYSSCVKIRCQETLQRKSHCWDLWPSND